MRDTVTLYDASCVTLSAMTVTEGWKVLCVDEAKENKWEQE